MWMVAREKGAAGQAWKVWKALHSLYWKDKRCLNSLEGENDFCWQILCPCSATGSLWQWTKSNSIFHHRLTPLLPQQPLHEYCSTLTQSGRTNHLLAYLHYHAVVELEEPRRVVIDIRHMDMQGDVTELSRVAVVCGSNCQGITGDLEDL